MLADVVAVVAELLKAVLEIQGKIEEYNAILDHIASTLREIEPIVKQIDDLNVKLEMRREQTKLLWETIEKGKSLLNDCASEIEDSPSCCCFKKKHRYLKKLQDLDKSLTSFFTIVVSLRTYKEVIGVRETQDKTNESMLDLHQKMDKILAKNAANNSASGDETRSSSAPTRVPERSATPVPDHREQVLGDYERANSKRKDDVATPAIPTPSLPTGFTAAAPKEYAPPSLAPQASGFAQEKPNLEEDRHQDHVKPESRKFKQVPEKAKQVPNTYFPDDNSKAAISHVALNDSTRGASFGKDSPSGRHSSYPAGPVIANYGSGIPPKSPETKAIRPAQDQYWNVAPTTTAAANPAPPRPYIPPDPHETITTNFAKDPPEYSSSTEKRSTRPTSRDVSLTGSYVPRSSQPRTKEVDHDQGNLIPDKWKTGHSNPGQTIMGTVAPEIKKSGDDEWRRHKSTEEYWSSDGTDG